VTVTYNAEGGFPSSATQTHYQGFAYGAFPSAPVKPGYTFKGWYTSSSGGTKVEVGDVVSAATTLHAQWTANKYTVSFDKRSGTGGTTAVAATYGAAMPAVSRPTRSGYSFGGYFSSPNGAGTQYYSSSGSSMRSWDKASNTTLYAQWTPSAYTVVFNASGGYGTMAARSFAYGANVTLPANAFTCDGHVFVGWATSNGGPAVYANGASAKNLTSPGGRITLYAVWAKKTYKVKFYANGGKGKMSVQTFTYGKAKKLSANKFKRSGCVFRGWATSKALAKKGKVAYKNKQAVKNLVANGKTVKLYAVWGNSLSFLSPDGSVTFSTGGNAKWKKAKIDGRTVARSGTIRDLQKSWIKATFSGKGRLRFSYNVSSENGYDKLTVYLDREKIDEISGNKGDSGERDFEGGTHTLMWEYAKDVSYSRGRDCAWIYGITWTPE
jgi:uncharacterized repeat protein (TIGR02543 family)